MLKRICFIIFVLGNFTLHAQIINDSFEISEGLQNQPKSWGIKKVPGYFVCLDSSNSFSGKSSLKITGTLESIPNTFIPFSQNIDVSTKKLKVISIMSHIKTENVKGNVQLWCQILDKNNRMVGFQSFELQNNLISGSNDWHNYELPVIVDTSAHKLLLGGLLKGIGTVWFDDFKLKDMSASNCRISDNARKNIDNILTIIKKHSLYSDIINWKHLTSDAYQIGKSIENEQDIKIVFDYIVQELHKVGDNHSFLQNPTSASAYVSYSGKQKKSISKIFGDNVAYILVPGFASTNNQESLSFAKEIQRQIREAELNHEITGWIVDLRENSGGNMYPMIVGLGPLIGEGDIGSFIKKSRPKKSRWFYQNGSAGISKSTLLKIDEPYHLINQNCKILVLIGPNTSSSGEVIAISFIGKPNVTLMGQSTAGLVTGNEIFKLASGYNLVLSTTFVADRQGKIYKSKITPEISTDKSSMITSDQTIIDAISILK